ncbi:MAG TPA: DUF4360 domain-containing protein [Oligoflexus sp.]|uniref:DUF4360 domain-containing protein n=1 Tax=Oligoflexus sp. TaxID=1971216 RepID=UPI002D465BB9|nr:DUF4360 domain-containing protein [Oligoflexus sp.]HYX32865.1 DUF4360 domain-containing protein [Oligoflexus sp.]
MKKVVAILGSMVLSSVALAEGSTITGINLSGSGCSVNDTRWVITEDFKTVSLFFDNYFAETTPEARVGRASCNLGIALKLPPGITVQVDTIDFRGAAYPAVSIDAMGNEVVTGSATLSREYFFAGMRGARDKTTWNKDTAFTVRDTVLSAAIAPCGGETILRVNTSLEAKRGVKDPTGQTWVGLDTIDVNRTYDQQINLSFIPCH